MTQTIIEQYQISLQNQILDYQEFGKTLNKRIEINNGFLGEFLNSFRYAEELSEVIDSLNQTVSNPNIEAEHGTETIDIIIYQTKVDFYTFDDGFVYTIPTSDFKQIVEGWRDFLQTPPLNGAYTVS